MGHPFFRVDAVAIVLRANQRNIYIVEEYTGTIQDPNGPPQDKFGNQRWLDTKNGPKYFAEKFLGKKKGKVRVKWWGYTNASNTWEPKGIIDLVNSTEYFGT